MLGEEVLYGTVGELAERIRTRRVSPVALTESYLARIEMLDPKLHAFATVTRERALEQARQAEHEIAAGRYRGPLHGIPYGAKDLLSAKGFPTTWGAKPYERQVLDQDATVIQKLEKTGAVLLGKLAMIELAGGMGYTIAGASLTGPARNPWDTGKWTCGSSSGSGAAVSAGLVGFAIGSETWGSIVCPSSFCGISGLRPTFGRVSRYGAMPLSWTMDKLGPMARSAADCETVLAAIAGVDPLDEWSASEPISPPLAPAAGRRLKAAWVRLDFDKSGEPEVKAAFEQSLADLKRVGLTVEEATLPDLPFEAVAGIVISSEAVSAFEELFGDGRIRQLVDKGAPLARAAARPITAADYVKASRIRTLCQRAMAEFFTKWDVLLAPGEMMTALSADESFEDVAWSDPVGAMGNLCGLPAVAVPCGFGRGGLPAALSIVGGAFEEAKVLAVARLYQEVTDFHRKRPPLHVGAESA
jgi:aspartyl-tRNA(Asn)/glutamyl-tRNA(Gln) amidotransferase subunit A